MVIIKQSLLERFSKEHAETRKSLATWRQITENAFWENRQDVLRSFPNAKMIKNNRARFEIVHNKYRLIAEIYYGQNRVDIRFIGTHSEYEKIDPSTI
ncbi:MAG: type II toxin-antitoxin system HigB family toxin [Sediminibacterium sp.]|nr:type II toxin-antitoxin system HigB family toxin [Sediminibacterium sp.]MBX9781476.1 type II toxin-antitoxin system HigB family toxin [Chitinophagaceae bacterium]